MTATETEAAGLSVLADLSVRLGRVADAMEREQGERDEARRAFQRIHQVPIAAQQLTLSGGAGTLDLAEALGPKTGYYWGVRFLYAAGFTAGSVTVYSNSVGAAATGTEEELFSAAGSKRYGKAQWIMPPGSRLFYSATGITGSVTIHGVADNFETWLLPYYLGHR